ncbi:MAG: tetratricopeptide repeat protein [Myxococcota bacterium]
MFRYAFAFAVLWSSLAAAQDLPLGAETPPPEPAPRRRANPPTRSAETPASDSGLGDEAGADETGETETEAETAETGEAETTESVARERFRAGSAHMESGAYLDAYAEFAAGYALTRRPLFLYNMGQAARLARNRDDAIRDYRRYLEEDPNGAGAGEAREWLRMMGQLEEEPEEAQTPVVPTPAEAAAAAPPEPEPSSPRVRRVVLATSAVVVAAVVAVVLAVVLSGGESRPQGTFGSTVRALGGNR